tara:strand:- start:218 stop:1174 length:957 start_codon:yes stop_codon:yes gene_type:complete
MATQAEIKAERKEKLKLKKEATDKKTKAAREKFSKRNKDFLTKYQEKQEATRRRRNKKAALKADLKGEESLAESRTLRGQGKGNAADLKLRQAERSKATKEEANKRLATQERVKKLKKEGKTANEIFRDRLDKKPIVKKPVVKKSTRATDKGGRTRASGSEGFKPQSLADQKTGPNMGQVNLKTPKPGNKSNADSPFNKPKAKKSMVDRAKKAVGIGRPATAKEQMGRDLQKNARKSMGMNMGGKVKKMNMGGAPMNARGRNMADMEGRAMATGRFRGMPGKMADARGRAMKKGGMVKKCKMDGIALRGLTRAKERSK